MAKAAWVKTNMIKNLQNLFRWAIKSFLFQSPHSSLYGLGWSSSRYVYICISQHRLAFCALLLLVPWVSDSLSLAGIPFTWVNTRSHNRPWGPVAQKMLSAQAEFPSSRFNLEFSRQFRQDRLNGAQIQMLLISNRLGPTSECQS